VITLLDDDTDRMPLEVRYSRLRSRVRFWWPVAVSFSVGMLLIPIVAVWWAGEKDRRELAPYLVRPVVTVDLKIAAQDEEGITVELSGVKHAPCTPLSINAYVLDELQRSDVVRVTRLGAPRNSETIVNRPVGPFYAGFWRIDMAPQQTGWLEMSHDCRGTRAVTILHRFVQAAE
jgi:hypothetical protein